MSPNDAILKAAKESKAPVAPSETYKPSFAKMEKEAEDEADKSIIRQLKDAYKGQSPDVQTAIGAFLNPDSTPAVADAALEYLKSKGIDLIPSEPFPIPYPKNRDWQSGRGM